MNYGSDVHAQLMLNEQIEITLRIKDKIIDWECGVCTDILEVLKKYEAPIKT